MEIADNDSTNGLDFVKGLRNLDTIKNCHPKAAL
jgi:hypothetical protein